MRTPSDHLKTIQRRIDFLKSREHKNSFDHAELGSLEWALVNLQPDRQWVELTVEEIIEVLHPLVMADMPDEATDYEIARAIEAKVKEKNQ